MTYSPILLEHVALVRRVVAASGRADVARVGKLGEIIYLVDEEIAQAEVEIYDAMISSEQAGPRRALGIRRMQQHRDAIEPYVGRNLLKTGIRCESRQYEIFVDPTTETIVHFNGFDDPDAPEPPLDGSPADRARWIFEHPRDGYRDDGQRVVELLLAGREVADLSNEELSLLAKGYNWWGHHGKSFETVKLGLAREPQSSEWLSQARIYVWNAFCQDLPRYLTACDECIRAGIGPAAFWHLLKADQYLAIATGERERAEEEYEWSPGDPILHPELLRPAAESLEAALADQPGLREPEQARDWVGDFNARFAAALLDPPFKHLAH